MNYSLSSNVSNAAHQHTDIAFFVVLFFLIIEMPLVLFIDLYFFMTQPPELFVLSIMLGLSDIAWKIILVKLGANFMTFMIYWGTSLFIYAKMKISKEKILIGLMLLAYLVNAGASLFFSRYSSSSPFTLNIVDVIFNPYNQNAIISALLASYFYFSKRFKTILLN